jgi:methylase of polypeptide subunit release factors
MTDHDKSWDGLFSHKKQELHFEDAVIVVEDGVFTPDPRLTYSTSIIIESLPPLNGLRVADVGTGTGVIAIVAALRGAKEVVATDISDIAVQNAVTNVSINKVADKVEVLKTNLLDGIKGRFDLICANLPILGEVWEPHGVNARSTIESFLKQAKSSLNPGGKIYLSWASFANELDIRPLFGKYGYNYRCVNVERLGYTWYLYILTNERPARL